ncbi:MAG TPA: CocE/NonD family hydrolase [Chitinophagaceae bacterium]|nr:CocE/NonD family hydrolase [Chitinophagaceae bacterium]HRG92868.1 CocE/NonD family hydrolase [Chitinophagaceae bacterium]
MKNTLVLIALLTTSFFAQSQSSINSFMKENYDKFEYLIPMRDGVKLFTLVYMPKDRSKTYPILMNRTCYNASGYANFNPHGHPSDFLVRDMYIFVFQDVRGRYMSEGTFDNMRPNIPGNDPKNKTAIDESSDTWDSIDWMVKNLKGNNGRVGIYGISYPGFYSAASLPDAHPALKAVSPQAPISDFFFDDFHHMGAYLESYTAAFAVFGYQKKDTTRKDWYMPELMRLYGKAPKDGYNFWLKKGPLKNITSEYHHDNFFWQQIIDHPNYDTFWQKRSLLPHLKNIKPAVLTVGGWFDAEDLFGPINIYKTIEKNSPGAKNTIVMGPWGHGDWAGEKGKSTHNHLYFGDSISTFYQKEIEFKFFARYLKDQGTEDMPEAYVFNTGTKKWEKHEVWPPKEAASLQLRFEPNGKLVINKEVNTENAFEYISDPAKPVPYTSQTEGLTFTPRNFMSDDQRQASMRPDVLTFETEVLGDDMTIAGEILAKLKVAISSTDADFIVKLIDVYPDNHPNYEHNPKNIVMGGYQQLVRSEVFRGRFRNSFEKPEPFVPGQPTDVNVPLQDVLHTFKKGHKIMIQIHSTWFPYIDRNPQKYVDNIYKAEESDFIKSTIKVLGSSVIGAGGQQQPKKGF